jgi:hypothetical protein
VTAGPHKYTETNTVFSEEGDSVIYNKMTGKFEITRAGVYELSVCMTAFLPTTPDRLAVTLLAPNPGLAPLLISEVYFPDQISTTQSVYSPLSARAILAFTSPTEITISFEKTLMAAAQVANTVIFIRRLQ